MPEQTKRMRPIWFFVGLLLLIIGLIITGSGIYYVFNKPPHPLKLYDLHPDVWWGGLMVLFGIIFLWVSKRIQAKH